MKVRFSEDEWYPVYNESEYGQYEIEMTEEEYSNYKLIMKRFKAIQDIIGGRYDSEVMRRQ